MQFSHSLKQLKKTFVIFLLLFSSLLIFPSKTLAATTYDMSNPNNWNVRFDGHADTNWLGDQQKEFADIDGDGKKDLIIHANLASFNSRSFSGSVYVVSGNLLNSLSGKGNTIDLSNSSNYNLRIDGAAAGDTLGFRPGKLVSLNSGQNPDFVINARGADNNGRSSSGSVYVLYNSLITGYLITTGNTLDLSQTSSFNIRFDGATAIDLLGNTGIEAGDFDNDEKKDLVFGATGTSYNSLSGSGSVYLVSGTQLVGYSGTGNTVDLNTGSNYWIRIDGALASGGLGEQSIKVADYDDDNKDDLFIDEWQAGFNSRSTSGSIYILNNSLLAAKTGSGNLMPLATASNFSIRYDGGSATEYLGIGITVSDLDNDGYKDFVFTAQGADYNSKSGSGSFYIIFDPLIRTISGTGNIVDLATSSNYNLRVDGSVAGENIGYYNALAADFNNDGLADLVVGSLADHNGRSDAGSVYIFYNNFFSAYKTTTGNTADATNASIIFDGAVASDYFSEASLSVLDIDNDGSMDIFVGAYSASNNNRSSSGSVYLIYNFPHTTSLHSTTNLTKANEISVSGTISAPNSVTTIAGVEYSLGNSSPLASSWKSCEASDGRFNSLSERYSCAVSLDSLVGGSHDGRHTLYVRSVDTNWSYTAQSHYATASFTYDGTAPVLHVLNTSNPALNSQTFSVSIAPSSLGSVVTTRDSQTGNDEQVYYTKDQNPTIRFKTTTDALSGVDHYDVLATKLGGANRGREETYLTAISASPPESSLGHLRQDDNQWLKYLNSGSPLTAMIEGYTKRTDHYLADGEYSFKVKAYDEAGNSATTSSIKVIVDTSLPYLRVSTIGQLSLTIGNLP